MTEEKSQEVVNDTQNIETEGGDESEFVKVPKTDWEKTNQTLGSLKRELKDLKKPKEEVAEKSPSEEFGLLQKTFLVSSGIKDADEIELAKEIQKKTGVEWDKLVEDDYFQSRLTTLRNTKENALATNVTGGSGGGVTKSADFFIAKGIPPTAKDIPDRKARVAIIEQMMSAEKNGGGKFYNE